MGNLPKDKSNFVSKEHVCEGKYTNRPWNECCMGLISSPVIEFET